MQACNGIALPFTGQVKPEEALATGLGYLNFMNDRYSRGWG
jgi:hypothetical protein